MEYKLSAVRVFVSDWERAIRFLYRDARERSSLTEVTRSGGLKWRQAKVS